MRFASRLLEIMLFTVFLPIIIPIGCIKGIIDLFNDLNYEYKERFLR